jgi:hypothetical protein
MKIRYSFVSNSSSASFIIDSTNLSEIAGLMFNHVYDNNSEYLKLMDLCSRSDVQNGKYGVTFKTNNYDTYLILNENQIFICTDRRDWQDILPHNSFRGMGEDDDEDKCYQYMEHKYFYPVVLTDDNVPLKMELKSTRQNQYYKCEYLDEPHNCFYYYRGENGKFYCSQHYTPLRRMTKSEINKYIRELYSNKNTDSFIVSGIKLNDLVESIYDQYIDEVYNWGLNEEQRDRFIDDLRDQAISTLELCDLPDVQNGERGITFMILDYDTYLLVYEDKIYISTCDNIHWIKGLPNSVNIEYIGRGKDSGKEDECDLVMKSFYFYSSSGDKKPISYRIDNIAVNSGDFYTCPKCNDGRRVYWAYEGEDGHYYCVEDYTRLIKIE